MSSRPESAATGAAFHAQTPEAVAAGLNANPDAGLSSSEAAARRARFGPNELQRIGVRTWWSVLLAQFVDFLIAILLLAAMVSFAIGQTGDALTIVAVVILNGCLGFVQEWRAERSLSALRSLLASQCTVVRDGIEQRIDTAELVPGDVVQLNLGERVPADIRLIDSMNLRIDEAALTGESLPVSKDQVPVPAETPLAARSSMAWMGSAIVNGHGAGLVVATGMATEFGHIAVLTQSVGDEPTPLQKRLGLLGKRLGVISIGLSAAVALLGWALGRPLLEMFFTGVALAVAIVPEALPIVVTTTLALGVRAMVSKRALFRRLQASETLGSVTVICTDKTGTITTNEMTVTELWLPSGQVAVTGQGHDPAGRFERDGKPFDHREAPELMALLQTAMTCNHARLHKRGEGWHCSGDPTESALLVAASKAWLAPDEQEVRLGELSFNSERKRMSVIVRDADASLVHVKGAPEVLLPLCSHIQDGDRRIALDPAMRKRVEAVLADMSGRGLRVLALANRTLESRAVLDEASVERDLTFLGLAGIMDPPRPEVAHAIQVANQAGIRVILITGDAGPTALAVADRIGLKVSRAITGDEVEAWSDAELGAALRDDVLFARTSPRHKLRIVALLQTGGEVVAMTGDGVNDAPALKKADVGVAMGIRGTDVARSASDLILLDDNFRTIVAAVEEGRRQFDNIHKFVRYILSAHLGEVLVIFLNIVLGGPLILLPVQILWMNLVTDSVTAIALGVEPGEAGRMQRPPRDPQEPLPNRQGLWMIVAAGIYIALATVGLFYFNLGDLSDTAVLRAQTIAFTGLIVLEKVNVINFRSLDRPMGSIGWFSNPWLLLAIALTVGAHLCAVYVPFMQQALHTVALSWRDWLLMLAIALPLFVIMEASKRLRAARASHRALPG